MRWVCTESQDRGNVLLEHAGREVHLAQLIRNELCLWIQEPPHLKRILPLGCCAHIHSEAGAPPAHQRPHSAPTALHCKLCRDSAAVHASLEVNHPQIVGGKPCLRTIELPRLKCTLPLSCHSHMNSEAEKQSAHAFPQVNKAVHALVCKYRWTLRSWRQTNLNKFR